MEPGFRLDSRQTDYFLEPIYSFTAEETSLYSSVLSEFKRVSSARAIDSESALKEFDSLLRGECRKRRLLLPVARGALICRVLSLETYGLGPLDLLLTDPFVEEVSFFGSKNPFYVCVKNRGWLKTNVFLRDDECALELVNKLARTQGRRLTLTEPRLNASLASNDRLHATSSPVCLNGVEFTVRKFKEKPFTVPALCANSAMPFRLAAALSLLIFSDLNACVLGNTGSGKTTLLNSLFSFIPLGERVVVTEDVPELSLPQPHVVRLVSTPGLGIGLSELVGDTLRMRPDRVVIGEVRSKTEAAGVFDALLAGQARGTYFTFHSRSCQEALNRLALLGAGADELGAIDLLLSVRRVQRLDEKKRLVESRRVTEVLLRRGRELAVVYDGRKVDLTPVLARAGESHSMNLRELELEVYSREAFLRNTVGLDLPSFTASFQKKFYGVEGVV